MPLILGANSLAGGGYEIDNSLRFNSGSSDYLNKEHQEVLEIEKLGHFLLGLKIRSVLAITSNNIFY
jgi:hypothetical protein